MPRTPEQNALRNAWAKINSVIVGQTSITTFGNYLTQHGFLGQQVVQSILSVGAIDDTAKVARLMNAVQTKIEYAPSPSQKYKELVLLLHDDLGLTDLAQIMVDACKECYKERGLSYESPLEPQPAPEMEEQPNELPLNTQQVPVNPRTESNDTSSNQLRRRNGNREQNGQEERSSNLPGNESTAPEKDQGNEKDFSKTTDGISSPLFTGTSRCRNVALIPAVGLIFIFMALYIIVYRPLYHSQENEIPLDLNSLSKELQDIEEWSNICTYFKVKKFLKDRIEDEFKTVEDRREKCLAAYLDSGRASWQHVVDVISKYPFYKCALGMKIAKKYHVPLPECVNDND